MANRRHAMYTPVVTVGVLQNAGRNQTDTVTATTGSVFVAQSPEPFGYDAKGHLTPDTVWAYSYDHADGLGSVSDVTTNGGFTVESYTYDVYGTPTMYNAAGSPLSASAIGNRLLFTARDRDPTTTLYNYRYRYYSPSLGRFTQPDPIGINGGDLNLYRYVANRPAVASDPYGLTDYDPVQEENCRREKAQRDTAIIKQFLGDALSNVGGQSIGGALLFGGIVAGIGAAFGPGAIAGAKIGGEIGLGVGALSGLYQTFGNGKAWDELKARLAESKKTYEACLKSCRTE